MASTDFPETIDSKEAVQQILSDMASSGPPPETMDSKEAVQQILSDMTYIDLPDDNDEAKFLNLPDKSYIRYVQAYEKLTKWQKSQNTDSFKEEELLAYFNEASKIYAPSTLWSTYSMLKSTIKSTHNVNIAEYSKLIAFLKKKNVGFQSKKVNVFTADEVQKFLNEAPDEEYLAIKAVAVFGICGACRGEEITSVRVDYVKDYVTELVVRIPDSKTKKAKVYPISGSRADIVRKYLRLRPQGIMTNRLFIQYRGGKCTQQVIGRNSIAQMPRKIAEYLKLPLPACYTGHSFRKTSTKILADAGAGIEAMQRNDLWRSLSIVEGEAATNGDPLRMVKTENECDEYSEYKITGDIEMASNTTISTHVLDTSRGRAAVGIYVSLTKLHNDEWTLLAHGETNQDGRVSLGNNYSQGTYKLHFAVEKYFQAHQVDAFYPFVEVTFIAKEGEKYHIPLLLNPFGYSTYRGT